LQSNEFNSGAFAKNADGTIYFGGINGLNYFNPKNLIENKHTPNIVLTKILVSDQEYQLDTISGYKKQLLLPYEMNTLSFEVSALEFSFSEKNKYAFKLEGVDNKWFYNGNKQFIRYSALAPGKYILWVKASNNDEVWSVPQKIITIIIQPPFWKTWWFRSLVVIAFVLIIALIVYFFLKIKFTKKIAELERQKEIDNLRIQISQDIHDDIGSNLTKVAMLCEIVRKNFDRNENIDTKLDQLARSSRKIIEDLREIVWSVNPRYDNIESLVSFMRNYTSNFLDETPIQWSFNADQDWGNIIIKPDFRRNFIMCFKEALNNIIKHANASQIEINIALINDIFTVSVQDNGKGFDINKSHTISNGLQNMKKRMENIAASCNIHSNLGKGTTTIFSIKIKAKK